MIRSPKFELKFKVISLNLQFEVSYMTHNEIVEILAFGVYKSPLLLCETHTIDRTRLITFLDRRNSENS